LSACAGAHPARQGTGKLQRYLPRSPGSNRSRSAQELRCSHPRLPSVEAPRTGAVQTPQTEVSPVPGADSLRLLRRHPARAVCCAGIVGWAVLIYNRALDLKFQCARTFEVSGSHSPFLVRRCLKSDCTSFDHCLEVAVAVVTFESHRGENVLTGGVEDER